jgi:hypothetical protein
LHKNFGKKYVAVPTMIICAKHFLNIPENFLILALKMIIKKNGLDLKNFGYVAMAAMIIFVKHFLNIPDILFNSCFKNNI